MSPNFGFWPVNTASEHVSRAVSRFGVQALLTFDKKGVSSHPNHISVHRGVRAFVSAHKMPAWELISELPVFKFLGPLMCVWPGKYCFYSNGSIAREAMSQHRSQMVWYRRLWLAFSAYVYCNRLRKV